MRYATATLLLLMIGACTGKPSDNVGKATAADSVTTRGTDSVATSTPAPTPQQSAERPERMTDTSSIGGTSKGSRMKLVDSGLAFTTYYPEDDMVMKQAASDEGIGLRFVANFGGKQNDTVSAHFFFPSVASTVAEMNDYVTGEQGAAAAADWQLTGPATANCPWASVSYRYSDSRLPGTGGSICIGQHAGRAFYLITHYPAAHEQALESRMAMIISHFRWKDTGTGLVKE